MSLKTIESILEKGHKLTPMMEQYYRVKKEYPDIFLLFRMGDFYEVFFDDAIEISKILNIALTHRGKIGDYQIPMSGIPHHAANNYIDRLTTAGFKAVICDQVQDPKEATGIVERAVTQIVGPGMPYNLDKIEEKSNRYIAAAYHNNKKFYFVRIDFTTGHFIGEILESQEELIDQILIHAPKEFLTYMGQWESFQSLHNILTSTNSKMLCTYLSEDYFDKKNTKSYTKKLIPSFEHDRILQNNDTLLSPVGAISYYVSATQLLEHFIHIRPFKIEHKSKRMRIGMHTLSGLEIIPKSHIEYKDSLLGFFDKTQSALGSRFLQKEFLSPLFDKLDILDRQRAVKFFLDNIEITSKVRESLSKVRDIERILAKVTLNKVIPGDLLNLSQTIESFYDIKSIIIEPPIILKTDIVNNQLNSLQSLAKKIKETINDELGASLDKGNLIKEGANVERDRLAKLASDISSELLDMENRYRIEYDIPKLKIKSNNITGFFIEVSNSYTNKVPDSFKRKQTLVNAERYVTSELVAFEKEVLLSKERLEKLEREIFKEQIKNIEQNASALMCLGEVLAKIDFFTTLSYIAKREDFIMPVFSEEKKVLAINGAWHPLIKQAIKESFITHNLYLDEEIFFGLITGPNMAGKTTVMREVAIIQHLAQIGSFIPAQSATLPIIDQLFSRLGASDNILKGQSTFMVEMTETAEIIRHATDKSLIILDEVGRGTSTYDGLSIAWALVEYLLSSKKSFTLFATHYHELIDLINEQPQAKNLTMETKNIDQDVEFLYRLIEGHASQSFGIYVAKLAGLPPAILKRATKLLKDLERAHTKDNSLLISEKQLDFFSCETTDRDETNLLKDAKTKEIFEEVKSYELNQMTPIRALEALYEIQKKLHDINKL